MIVHNVSFKRAPAGFGNGKELDRLQEIGLAASVLTADDRLRPLKYEIFRAKTSEILERQRFDEHG
jgi:hypothetical protein